jgi:hypothetical protein
LDIDDLNVIMPDSNRRIKEETQHIGGADRDSGFGGEAGAG